MPRKDIEFKTIDHVTLRGWLYTSPSPSGKLPCLVMAHGWTALKEMDLDTFAEYFVKHLDMAVLAYDNRGFGSSDTKDGAPRLEIIPSQQQSDYSDAITYAQTLEEVDSSRIGIWGSSYSGGHVLLVAAIDRRVKAVLSQVPLTNGWDNFHRLIRPDFIASMNKLFEDDRHARAKGQDAVMLPVVSESPYEPAALPTSDSWEFFMSWAKKTEWKNECTVRSVELLRANDPSHMIHRISPTPLLMTVAENDCLTPTDIAIEAYQRAREPKQLHIIPGGHFDGYSGPNFEKNAGRQAQFLNEVLGATKRKPAEQNY